VQVLGHRGSLRPGPENSVAAVRAALAAGADGVEVDVRRTRDGQLVCLHDPALLDGVRERAGRTERLSDAARTVVFEHDARTLQNLGVPSAEQVLDAGASGRVVLEVKNQRRQPDYDGRRATSARLVAEMLERRRTAGQSDDVVVSSFDSTAIVVARAAGLPTALLTLPGIPVLAGLRIVERGGHPELHAHTSALPSRMPRRVAAAVARAHEQGIRLVVWTVMTTDDALRFRDAGVDGIICDDPATIVSAFAA
jgi:glycerophosphoryl diester phosphodiesterase